MKTCILLFLLTAFSLLAVNNNHIGGKKLYYGASYYPESWPMEQVDEDIALMQEVNMNVVRMAEFSWSRMEPEEGVYNFAWLHEIIEKLHAGGIDVILGTPTATPPAWLWEKYPEIGKVDDEGKQRFHGARKDYAYGNELYREKAYGIAKRMSKEFGSKPGVIGWQIDNELSMSQDFSDETCARWHAYLRERYGSIENLNHRWATDLWSQTYQRFDQIPMPVDWLWHHNSLRFEWSRFSSQLTTEFMNLQVDAIRKHSDLPITHDTMPGQSTNYENLMARADFMAVNNYHSFEAYDRVFSNYDRMRGYGMGYHWLFETAPNHSGGGKEGKMWFLHQPKGSLHAALWMNYALGGQGSLFWLWRQHRAGQEMVHGSIINAWGRKVANFDDLQKLGADLKKSSDFLMNNPVAEADVAIIYSHEADMGLRIENYVNDIRYYNEWTYRFYHALSDVYLHRDVIGVKNTEISQYKLIFAPLLPYIPDALRADLQAWVREGGTLVLGPVSGYRTDAWTFFTDNAYGDINEWSGVEVNSRIPVGLKRLPKETPLYIDWKAELGMLADTEAGLWSDALTSDSGKILARYRNGMHDGLPAIIENKVENGKVIILGTDPGKENLSRMLLKLAAEQEIQPVATGDPGVVIGPRVRKGQTSGYVVDNISGEVKSIRLPIETASDILTDQKTAGQITLQPYQVRVLEID
ncbi:MAG: beta-galactosidase [Puniceicoccaceae bacterium]